MEQVACETSPVFESPFRSRRAVSFPSTPSTPSRRSAISPTSILRSRASYSTTRLRRSSAESEASRIRSSRPFQTRQLLEPLLHTPHEAGAYRLDPIWRHPEFPGPPFSLVLAKPQIETPVGYAGPDGVSVHLRAYRFDAGALSRSPDRRGWSSGGTAADHVLAGFETLGVSRGARAQRGPPHTCTASVQASICIPRIEDDLPDDLGHEVPPGSAGAVCGRCRTCDQWSFGQHQGGLAREIRAFDRYDDAPTCTLRGRTFQL